MNGRAIDTDRAQCALPRLAEPPRRRIDIGRPARMAGWDEDIDPQCVAGLEQHGSSPAAPTDDVDPGEGACVGVDVLGRLRRTEHDRGPIEVEPPHARFDHARHFAPVEISGETLTSLDLPHRFRMPRVGAVYDAWAI